MEDYILYILAALVAYLIAGWNPAITLSKAIYKQDIRTLGSKNPGFTNFKRSFGNRWAWIVLALDISKGFAVVFLFACLFEKYMGLYQVGAVYTGIFAVLGHSFPVWYNFRGGKGFLVSLSVIWVTDWRAGLISTAVMIVLLLTTKYMSLSTVISVLISPVLLFLFKAELSVVALDALMVLFVAFRHRANFKRLISGNESKFYLKSHREK